MATIKDVKLSVNPGSDPSKRSVTVITTMGFDQAEIDNKKTFRYSISLHEYDGHGDTNVNNSLIKNRELYHYTFGSLFNRSILGKVKAVQLTQSFSETAEVPAKQLDEDSGGSPPNPDEVFATISLVAQQKHSTYAQLVI